MKEVSFDVGGFVECDGCLNDYTNFNVEGGIIFESKAFCPACAPRVEGGAEIYGETELIKARCPKGQSFADFVREYRNAHGGNTVTITTFGGE